MRIVPAPDRLVRDPETRRPLGGEGLTVDPTDLYWHRALIDGDVVEASAEEPAGEVSPPPAPAEAAAPAQEHAE